MNDNRQPKVGDVLDNSSLAGVNKGRWDLSILRYMAKKVHVSLHLSNQPINASQPLLYIAKERCSRTHRVAIYDSRDLLLPNSLSFVGFVSGQRKPAIAWIAEEIHAIDAKLVVELAAIPGILSYSSLELHDGNWYNLVLLSNANAKRHIQKSSTHAYAAYQLAPYHYEWIRLHNGVMPEGLASNEMMLQKTKYYTFQNVQLRPTIRELTYGA